MASLQFFRSQASANLVAGKNFIQMKMVHPTGFEPVAFGLGKALSKTSEQLR
jgi:hypothetical protein